MNSKSLRRAVRAGALVLMAASLHACSSGQGVPRANVVNRFATACIVEASFLGYNYPLPVLANGTSSTFEVYEGTGVAYAVTVEDPKCFEAARKPGGKLWVTRAKLSAAAGETTRLLYSEGEAVEVPADCGEAYMAGRRLFARLPAAACENVDGDGGVDSDGGEAGGEDATDE